MRVPDKAAGAADGKLRKTPGTETEVKLRLDDRKALLRLLQKLKARGGERMHEMNTLYDMPAGTLARSGKMVRIRVLSAVGGKGKSAGKKRSSDKQSAILTYKGPADDSRGSFHGHRYKIREEQELHVDDAGAMVRVLEGMGMRPWFRYEKYRTTYRLARVHGVVVELDETPIGDFVELEGDCGAIDCAAALLGYGSGDYITKSYGQLFVEQRRAAGRTGEGATAGPVDMLFSRRG